MARLDITPPAAGGGGDSITVNASAVVDADFDDATPAAPAGSLNVKWQKDASSPANVSGYVTSSDEQVFTGSGTWTKPTTFTLDLG